MKILHVISSVWRGGGGTSEVVPRLCRAQQESGHEVVLAVSHRGPCSDSCADAISRGVDYRSFCRSRIVPSLGYSSLFVKELPELVGMADIVHLHGLWQAPCWCAAAECRRQHKPYVMMPHGFLEPERLKISKWKKRIVGALIERRNLSKAAALIATSESEAEGLRQYGLKNPIHIMPIGIDVDDFSAAPQSRNGVKTLLYFSRITPIKGLDLLAEAWSALCQTGAAEGWWLLIVGPDDRGYTEEMKQLYAQKCPDGSYEFRGPIFGNEKYALLATASAFVLPTRSENWSIAVAEAMASGLPVVCTKGAPWKCLSEIGAGVWVDISAEAIAEGLRKVMTAQDEDLYAMGRRARMWVEDNLSWARISRDLSEFYKSIVK